MDQKTEVPRVSVVIPTYQNDLHYMKEAVVSILNQSFQDFEILFVDDGNTIECLKYMQELAESDQRVIVLQGPRRGIAAAINYGIAKARAPLIARMDADDIAVTDRFDIQVSYMLEHPEVDILGSNLDFIDAEGRRIPDKRWPLYENIEEIRKNAYTSSPMFHPTVMYRKASIMQIGGYDPAFRMAEDYELWLRALKKGLILHNLKNVLLHYRYCQTEEEKRGREIWLWDFKVRWKNFVPTWECIYMSLTCYDKYLKNGITKPLYVLLRWLLVVSKHLHAFLKRSY